MPESIVTITVTFQGTRLPWSSPAPQANVGKLLEEVPFCYDPDGFDVSRNGVALMLWDHFDNGDVIDVRHIR